jgi:hypothetical protein
MTPFLVVNFGNSVRDVIRDCVLEPEPRGCCQIKIEFSETVMDVLKMLSDLRQEREQIEEAIVTLERLAQGRSRRRGRPPAWMSALKRRGRPPGSKNKGKENAAAA